MQTFYWVLGIAVACHSSDCQRKIRRDQGNLGQERGRASGDRRVHAAEGVRPA